MTTRLYVEQDGRDFYLFDPIDKETIIGTWTAKDGRYGDTIENARAWRDMFIAYYVSRGYLPVFENWRR